MRMNDPDQGSNKSCFVRLPRKVAEQLEGKAEEAGLRFQEYILERIN
jgi:predicted DNA binding CopG/RHH family protein